MATKKYIELQGMNDGDLSSELAEMEAQFQKLKFDHAIKGLDNPIVLRDMGRDISRFKTEIRKREIAGMTEEQLNKRTKIRARRRKARK